MVDTLPRGSGCELPAGAVVLDDLGLGRAELAADDVLEERRRLELTRLGVEPVGLGPQPLDPLAELDGRAVLGGADLRDHLGPEGPGLVALLRRGYLVVEHEVGPEERGEQGGAEPVGDTA